MKKLISIILLCLFVSGFAYSQIKVTIALTNPGVRSGFFKFDVVATVPAGQTWKVGSCNLRVDFHTVPANGLTVHPDNPVDSALTCLNSVNYSPMTTTSINGGTAISLNITHSPSNPCCTLAPGSYLIGRIRFNRIDTTVTTCDTIRYTSVMFDSLTQLTYGSTSTPGWARTNPTPPCPPVTGISGKIATIPTIFKLYDNYPNPFNPSTTIKYDIPKTSRVKIIIFDLLGREVEVLVNERKEPGSYDILWNATNYASGAYFYKLETESYTDIKKMILLK
jgi:hypothetical protein